MKKVKNKFSPFQHIATGIVLLLKAFDKIEHNYYIIGSVISLFAIFIISYAVYERRQLIHNEMLDVIVHFSEAVALLFMTYIFIEEGKTYIQFFTLAASLFFFILAVLLYRRMNKRRSNPMYQESK